MNNNASAQTASPDDYVSSTIVFGEMKKSIYSKNFRGGFVTNVFGSTQLDFGQADINGSVTIDISQTFGETIIKVPADWFVITHHAAIFAEVKDKRTDMLTANNTEKTLVLKGYSAFGAVTILNCA
ncbi:cell wall-active antibiotics response protein [Mucilaginibacter sp. X4EP1]|jgi:predicted membrane protein|uniref:cell wall-active antibiotics response protein n=1 Tax=Mucilaginibacter sp. X4EP1 TaxID=2723092 RepID=UPI00216A9577|nr:cell wall-active antibiotics response protein [Mucilaginibacter sp. X4EP1]MCS3812519.1 putative membrane protein [Mucilaginibacter sp. X4EP1]